MLLLYADVPLLRAGTLARLIEAHQSARAAATVLTAELEDPYGYGRIVRDRSGKIVRIVEERDASGEERAIREVNSGIYAFALAPLFEALDGLAADNAQSEYYLTDLVVDLPAARTNASRRCSSRRPTSCAASTAASISPTSAACCARARTAR